MKKGKAAKNGKWDCMEVEDGVAGEKVLNLTTGQVVRLTTMAVANSNLWNSAIEIKTSPSKEESYIGEDGEIHFRKARKPAARTPASKVMGGGYYD